MKRRRGNKKAKAKKPKLVEPNGAVSNASLNTGDNSGLDESDNVVESGIDAEKKSSPTGTGPSELPAKVDSLERPVNSTSAPAVYTRVKVKIKNSRNLESNHTSSHAPTPCDADKSSQQICSEKQLIPDDKMEDSSNSLSETNGGVSANSTKKSMGIKIKSSRGFGSSSMSPCSNTETLKGEKTEKDPEPLNSDSKHNEQELKTALEVIRKVMKMDAAEPFNVPVNPVALGIPDYFDVIDTPMDFGTICSNLEKGVKYMNSEDVFRDVEYIWDNCYKYNNKGDYIVELMKRVKKNFLKYWAAVGLSSDQPQDSNGVDSTPVPDIAPSNQGTTQTDSGALSLSSKKFHGLKKHKEGCLCAICVMMRRRQEREEIVRMMDGETEGSEDSMGEETKPEGVFRRLSPFGTHGTSNIENLSDADVDLERRGQAMKLGHLRNFYGQDRLSIDGKGEGSDGLLLGHGSGDDNIRHYQLQNRTSGGDISSDTGHEMPPQDKDVDAAHGQQMSKVLDKNQRRKMLENLRYLENPMLLELYGTLFSESSESLWSGPHSMVARKSSTRPRSSSIHSAISTFMKS